MFCSMVCMGVADTIFRVYMWISDDLGMFTVAFVWNVCPHIASGLCTALKVRGPGFESRYQGFFCHLILLIFLHPSFLHKFVILANFTSLNKETCDRKLKRMTGSTSRKITVKKAWPERNIYDI